MMSTTLTPRPKGTNPALVSEPRRGQRTRFIKVPYDPANNTIFRTANAANTPQKKAVPSAGRALLSIDNLQDVIGKATVCRKCKSSKLEFSTKTTGIATTPIIYCGNCEQKTLATLNQTSFVEKKTKHVCLTDYPINVLYVLTFLSVGDGGSEAQRLLGLCDMPNATSMERSTFSTIERQLSPLLVEMAEESMFKNLQEEIMNSGDLPANFDFEVWKKAVEEKDDSYPFCLYPKVRSTTDAGWQKRGSGFDSLSGHAFLFGAETHLPLWWCLKQKFCKVCSLKKDLEEHTTELDHECVINHAGSAASMEPLAVVDMLHDLNDQFKCHLSTIITDDDTKMQANCKWSNADYKKHYGKAPKVISKDGKGRSRKDHGKLRYPIANST